MNVAVYSGSFDPVHIGHQALARYVVSNVAGIDRLLLLVTPHSRVGAWAGGGRVGGRRGRGEGGGCVCL
ncbi:MAG: hypothetical protein K2M14_06735, partial [Muribaculaceae bacterium]|nr:hypothetical protein [Muribaculaceae bacterium]